jgi:hypothetical protein
MSNCLADCLQQGEINERFARRVHLDSVLQALATATADAPAIALSLTGIIDDLGLFDWIRSKLLQKLVSCLHAGSVITNRWPSSMTVRTVTSSTQKLTLLR